MKTQGLVSPLLDRQSCRQFPSVPHSVLLNNSVPCTGTECSPMNTMDGLQVAIVIKAVSVHSGTLQFLFSLCRAGPASGLSWNLHINAYLSTKGGNIRKKCTVVFSILKQTVFYIRYSTNPCLVVEYLFFKFPYV